MPVSTEIITFCIRVAHLVLAVVTQEYLAYVHPSHVIRGNDVLFKCDIPSFVADFVSVAGWMDNAAGIYTSGSNMGKWPRTKLFCMLRYKIVIKEHTVLQKMMKMDELFRLIVGKGCMLPFPTDIVRYRRKKFLSFFF